MAEEGESPKTERVPGETCNEINNFTDEPENEDENANNNGNNQRQRPKIGGNNKKNEKAKTKSIQLNINTLYIIVAIIVLVISAILYNYLCGITPSEIENYECPDSPIYIPANGKQYEIDAFSKINQVPEITSTSNIKCEWKNIVQKPKLLLISGIESCKLKLQNTIAEGKMDVKLEVKFKNDKMTCPLKIIFHQIPYFGIDLGTTYSSIAYQKTETDENGKRKYEIVALDKNSYSIPTAIYIPPNNYDSIQLGQNALNMRHKYPENVIYDIKRIIGRRASDNITVIEQFNDTHSFIVDVDKDNKVIIKIPKYIYNNKNEHINTQYEHYYPEETLSPILTHLVHTASKKFDVPYITDIVVSVPAYFNNHQRKAVINSCKIAGLNPVQLVIEPTAAALSHAYYALLPEDAFDLFMVFDYGGGTLDCSILQCVNAKTCEVFYVGGDSLLGGIDYDHVIVNIMKKKFKQEYGWKTEHFTPEKNAEFLLKSEQVKLELTQQLESNPILISNDSIIITRTEFENDEQTQKLLKKAIKVAKETINGDPDHTEANIKMILMVGGTSQIPIVRSKLQQAFGAISIPKPTKDCQLTVVKGTSVIGGELAFGRGGVRPVDTETKRNIIDVTPFPLGFRVCDGYIDDPEVTCNNMDIAVRQGQKYPVQRTKRYTPANKKGMWVNLELFEGNNAKTDHNFFISDVAVSGFTKDLRLYDVILQINENGIVEINATVQGKEDDVFIMKPLSVLSDDRGLTKKDITKLRRKMATYDFFPSEIQAKLSQ